MSVALQRKVHKVLDSRARFDKPQVAEAIQGLSLLAESDAATSALSARGSGGAPASLTLHRHFRSLLESRSVSLHRSLLDSFAPVQAELEALDASLEQTGAVALELAQALRDIKARSTSLYHSAEALQQQKAELADRQAIVATFLARFKLDPRDAALLASTSEESIGDEFFAALDKIEGIKANIQAMLVGGAGGAATPPGASSPMGGAGAGGSSRISLDLLDSLSAQLESSYELLYRFVSRSLQSGAIVKVSDLVPKFTRSVLLLRNVPVYFDHVLSDLLSARRALLLERFLKALSRGSGGTRPIELSAHDPVRYASDMLAWIHQALANEKEFLIALFPPSSDLTAQQRQQLGATAAGSTHAAVATAAANSTGAAASAAPVHCYQQYLATIFEALSRPLRVRIEQSFASAGAAGAGAGAAAAGSSPVGGASASSSSSPAPSASVAISSSQVETVFKIWNILKFYGVIIAPILPSDATDAASAAGGAEGAYAYAGGYDAMANGAAGGGADGVAAGSGSGFAATPATDLVSTLSLLADHARSAFFSLLASAGARLTRSPPAPSADLTAGPEVSSWVAQLGAVMSIYNSALVAPAEKEEEFATILDRILEPLLQCIGLRGESEPTSGSSATAPPSSSSSAAAIFPPVDADQLIYRINVLQSLLAVCGQYGSFVRTRVASLTRLLEQQVSLLVQSQAHAVLFKVGLARAVAAVAAWDGGARGVPLSRCDGADLASLSAGVRSFYAALLSVGAFIVPQCDRLLSTATRRQVRIDIARTLSASYRSLYDASTDPRSGFDASAIGAVLLHAPPHVDVLLDLQGATNNTPMHRSNNSASGGSSFAYPAATPTA